MGIGLLLLLFMLDIYLTASGEPDILTSCCFVDILYLDATSKKERKVEITIRNTKLFL